jgi:hypothetical protein
VGGGIGMSAAIHLVGRVVFLLTRAMVNSLRRRESLLPQRRCSAISI